MGLLDDAIREHLELKRRHGADPEEVQRQEREALGAAQQRAEFAQPEGDAVEEAAPDEAGAEVAGSPDDEEPPEPGPEPERDAEAAAPEPPIGQEEDPWDVEELADTPPPEAEPANEPPEEIVRPDEEEPAAEDVLEETPDFLQETPEHERLWFEQKPPRDFDWDK